MSNVAETHIKRVELEQAIRREFLAILKEAEFKRGNIIVQSDADKIPLATFLIEAVQERIERGKNEAKLVPEF